MENEIETTKQFEDISINDDKVDKVKSVVDVKHNPNAITLLKLLSDPEIHLITFRPIIEGSYDDNAVIVFANKLALTICKDDTVAKGARKSNSAYLLNGRSFTVSEADPEEKKAPLAFSMFFRSLDLVDDRDYMLVKITNPESKKKIHEKRNVEIVVAATNPEKYAETGKWAPTIEERKDIMKLEQKIAKVTINDEFFLTDRLTHFLMHQFGFDIALNPTDPLVIDSILLGDYDDYDEKKYEMIKKFILDADKEVMERYIACQKFIKQNEKRKEEEEKQEQEHQSSIITTADEKTITDDNNTSPPPLEDNNVPITTTTNTTTTTVVASDDNKDEIF